MNECGGGGEYGKARSGFKVHELRWDDRTPYTYMEGNDSAYSTGPYKNKSIPLVILIVIIQSNSKDLTNTESLDGPPKSDRTF